MYQACVGIDWATTEHVVCALDGNGRRLSRFRVAHTEDGLDDLVARLGSFGDRADVAVGIERPDGLVVDRLLAWIHRSECGSCGGIDVENAF
jgi:hypothetical protein